MERKTNLTKYKHIIFSMATVSLFLAGMFLFLSGTSQLASADPSVLFVATTGSGSNCIQSKPCALQVALDQAYDGDTVYVAQGIYTGSGAAVITLTKSISLYGGWNGISSSLVIRDPDTYPAILDGEMARRGVFISEDITPTLDGFVIARGNATGLTENCFGDFEPDGCGGGIFAFNAHPVIANNVITNNTAVLAADGGPTNTIGFGGGLCLQRTARAVISGNVIISNTNHTAHNGNGRGGGLYLYGQVKGMQVEANQILSNTSSSAGGGLYMWYSSATLTGNTIHGNEATSGGGMFLWTGHGNNIVMRDNTISNNEATRGGGGIYTWDSDYITLEGNTILGNTAGQTGGGIQLSFSSANLQGNVIRNNKAITGGGAYLGVVHLTPLTNNVIIDNQATTSGAGLYLAGGDFPMLHNTFARNNGGDGSGIYVTTYEGMPPQFSSVTLTNAVLVNHAVGITVTGGNTMTADGILWHEDPITISAEATATVSVKNQHAGAPAFAADGYHLTGKSAAIDAGIDTAVIADIDGDPRPINRPDLGADEWEPRIYLPLMLREFPSTDLPRQRFSTNSFYGGAR